MEHVHAFEVDENRICSHYRLICRLIVWRFSNFRLTATKSVETRLNTSVRATESSISPQISNDAQLMAFVSYFRAKRRISINEADGMRYSITRRGRGRELLKNDVSIISKTAVRFSYDNVIIIKNLCANTTRTRQWSFYRPANALNNKSSGREITENLGPFVTCR